MSMTSYATPYEANSYGDSYHYDNYSFHAHPPTPPPSCDIEVCTNAPNGELVQKRAKIAFFGVSSLGAAARSKVGIQCSMWQMPVLEVDVRFDRNHGHPIAVFVLLNWSYEEAQQWVSAYRNFIEYDHGYGWRVEMAQIQPQQLTAEELASVEAKKVQKAKEKRFAKPQNQEWDPSTYKTRMCFHVKTVGGCPHGNNCKFAHSALELRDEVAPMKNACPMGMSRSQ